MERAISISRTIEDYIMSYDPLLPKAGSECWGGWSRAAFSNLWTFARPAILGILHVGTEWWTFEIVALVAGRLGTISLASQSVIMTADQIMNTIPFGLGVATSSRVGNLLGLRKAQDGARAAHSSALLAVTFGAIVLAILMAREITLPRSSTTILL